MPRTVIKAKCAPYLKHGKPERRPELMNRDDHAIISTYGAEYRGIVQYYLLAGDVWRLNRLEWVMKTSMLKTLARQAPLDGDEDGPQVQGHHRHTARAAHVLRGHASNEQGRKPLVARFGGIPLRGRRKRSSTDRPPVPATTRRKELITRLLAGRCELCEQRGPVEVHQVRKLADLTRPGRPQPAWAQLMAKMRRKTLIVCAACHAGHPRRQPATTPTE